MHTTTMLLHQTHVPHSLTRENRMRYFKLLAGVHHQADRDHKFTEEELQGFKEKNLKPRLPSKTYSQGEIVPSPDHIDLVEKCGASKFREVRKVTKKGPSSPLRESREIESGEEDRPSNFQDPTTHATVDEFDNSELEEVIESEDGEEFTNVPPRERRELPNLDKMNLEQLKTFAAEEEIDITGCTTKREIAAQITQSFQG